MCREGGKGSRDEKVLSFNVAIDGDKGGGEDGTRRNVRGAYLVFVYASGRLYITLEAREGTISVSFDKKQTLFAGRAARRGRTCPRQQNTPPLQDTSRYAGIRCAGYTTISANDLVNWTLNWIQMQSSQWQLSIESESSATGSLIPFH